MVRVSRWVKKVHIYAGLVSFTMLMVFGIAGLAATLRLERRVSVDVRTLPFTVPANATDLDAAIAAYHAVDLTFAPAPGQDAVRRDADRNVTFTLYSVSGPRVVTLLETAHLIRIEARRERLWHFFDNLHATTTREAPPDWRLRLWTWYVEFGIWSLIWMALSGVYLWMATRPRFVWARASFALGTGLFVALYVWMR